MLGYQKADGIFCPGGSYANLMSVLCAREKYFPHVRTMGWQVGDNPVMLTSDHDHYSTATAAQVIGLGLNNVNATNCISIISLLVNLLSLSKFLAKTAE